MRFVHSRGKLGVFRGGYTLDSRCNLRCIIEPGELGLPWSMFLHVWLNALYQIAGTFPLMVPCTRVVHLAEGPLTGVGPRTVRRQPAHLTTWRTGLLLLNGLRCMNTVVIRAHRDMRHLSSWVRGVRQREALPRQPVVFTRAEALGNGPGARGRAPARSCVAFFPGVMTSAGVPCGLHAALTFGRRCISSVSAKTRPARACQWSCWHCIRANRAIRCGASSLATSWARFHTQPLSWRQRRTVSADTARPCLAWSVAASVAQLPRVRHQP
jgi:hypothetical protein